ncbi:MAG: phosphoribosyl-AMP cyclohydrolase [Lentilitoribacter sp.]
MTIDFAAPSSDKKVLEQDGPFTPKFDEKGLVTTVVTDTNDGQIVMLAYMNAEALALTIETGIAHYYSRSRQELWKKGETSGNLQEVVSMWTDCDQDAVIIEVKMTGDGVACHTGRKSCFYRKVDGMGSSTPSLVCDQ